LDIRSAVLVVAVSGGVALSASTELLSLLGGLTFGWLLASWVVMLAAGVFLASLWGFCGLRRVDRPPPLPRGLDLFTAGWVAIVVALLGTIALSAVPITPDSMSYHLARVAHWGQNHTVAFYPTHIVRQLYQPPWAEYAMLHLYILAGGDRLANVVQWVAMVVSLVGVSVIARQLGASPRGQFLSVFVCATIPMGIMQASTTQNDYVAALWLVCLTSALLAIGTHPAPLPVLGAGASLGLAFLTKGTANVFAFPLVLVLLSMGRDRPVSRKLEQGLVIGLCALALNAPQYLRNFELFGLPLGPGGESSYRYMNDGFSPSILASNLLRNLGLHAGTPWQGSNLQIERAVDAMHRAIGIALDDPRSTWPGTRFEVRSPAAQEDLAGNGLHLLLIVAAMVGAGCGGGDRRLRAFAGCLLVAFLLFCVVLRWQPWHSRLHLPLFVLGAPLVGVVFERLRPTLLAIGLLLLAGSSVYFLAGNKAHHLAGRRSVFIRTWAEQRVRHAGPAYVGAASVVMATGCADVGLILGADDREYFLWATLADAGWRGRIEPVLVTNASASARPPGGARGELRPCVIVRQDAGAPAAELTLGARSYRTTWSRDDIQVLVPDLPRGASPADATSDPKTR
jgi:uncharacterized membrane protein YiaA